MAHKTFLGIDIGTSTTKAILVSESGAVLGSHVINYAIETPAAGAAEQHPDTWWEATASAVRTAQERAVAGGGIAAVGVTGQMHSAVFIGKSHQVLRPAILWADTRSAGQAARIAGRISARRLWGVVGNPVPAGFTAPSILWVKENEPEVYENTVAVIQPKDYVVMRLTGSLGTDPTDASATGLMDIGRGAWSREVTDALSMRPDILPAIGRCRDTAGTPTEAAAAELSIPPSIPVIRAGGDQPVQAVGNGIIRPGIASLTVGTGGQVLLPTAKLSDAPEGGRFLVNTFRHCVEDLFYHLGATLAAGLSLRWFRDTLAVGQSFIDLDREAEVVAPGADGLIFLPHLIGERTPHMNADARGVFFGIGLGHTQGHFARAVMEGVAFSLREAVEAVGRVSAMPGEVILAGGGAKSRVWSGIISNILGMPARYPVVDEGSAYGAALMAAVGSGTFRDIEEGVGAWVRYRDERSTPRRGIRGLYDGIYDRYREIYRRLQADPL